MRTAALARVCGCASRNEKALSHLPVDNQIRVTLANEAAIRRALETAGIDFIEDNGGGEGVRFRKPQKPKHGNLGAIGIMCDCNSSVGSTQGCEVLKFKMFSGQKWLPRVRGSLICPYFHGRLF
jgi:hypothetical protein